METKPWYKSLAILSALGFAVLQTLEQNQVIPEGGTKSVADLVQNILIVIGTYGIRRAIG